MDKEMLEKLKNMVCDEIEEMGDESKLKNMGDVETLHKLTDIYKNILKIEMLEDSGYSEDGEWEAYGSYDDGMSRDGRGGNRGGSSYNYDRGSSYRRGGGRKRNSMGRFSRAADSKEGMINELNGMMRESSSDKERRIFEKFIRELENA